MLVNPSTSATDYSAPATRQLDAPQGNGLTVRSDLPPVTQSPQGEGAQNNSLYQQPRQDGAATENKQDSPEKSDSAKEPDEVEKRQQAEDDNIIRQLKTRDREVRLHEASHAAVGGKYAGSPSFDYSRGPDGVNYAVGGEVSISTSEVPGNPQATIEKARVIRAAALAPAEPSAQDRRVASKASQIEVEAKGDLQQQNLDEEERARETREAEREKELEETQAKEPTDEPPETETEPVAVEPVTVSRTESSESSSDDEGDSGGEEESAISEDKPANAREALEEILLGSQSVPKQLNEAGFVDASNPYGKSGFFEYVV